MVIRVTLDKMLDKRGLSLTELGNRVGITLANLSILKTSKARAVRFSTLDAMCRELDCQPADLLVFETQTHAGGETAPAMSPDALDDAASGRL